MKTYCYYSNSDPKFEIIDKVDVKDYFEALAHFGDDAKELVDISQFLLARTN